MDRLSDLSIVGIPAGIGVEFVAGGALAQGAGSLVSGISGVSILDPITKLLVSAGTGIASEAFERKGSYAAAELSRATAISSFALAIYDFLPILGWVDTGVKKVFSKSKEVSQPASQPAVTSQAQAQIQQSKPSTTGMTRYERALVGSR